MGQRLQEVDISTLPFTDLEEECKGLLVKHASWRIPGLDFDDVYQELLLVLWKCQRSFTPGRIGEMTGKPVKFTSFLTRALVNRLGQLGAYARRRGRVWYQLAEDDTRVAVEHIDLDSDLIDFGLSDKARAVIEHVRDGGRRRKLPPDISTELRKLLDNRG